MKLCTFLGHGRDAPRLGAEHAGSIVDLAALCRTVAEPIPETLIDFIRAGDGASTTARRALEHTSVEVIARFIHAPDGVRLLPPLRPGKILCSGINYHGHFKENPSAKMPDEPFFFAKMPSVVIGPEDAIRLPRHSAQVDYEVEFAVVIGRTLRDAREADVMEHVFGYTILNDVSARDVQFKDNQITLGKNFDTFSPLGPCIATADELPRPAAIRLSTRLNGRVMQDSSTRDWVFALPKLLSYLSGVMTLEPGDVVTTGTPAGVGLFQKPPVFLRPGDVVELEIEGIGRLRNPVEASR